MNLIEEQYNKDIQKIREMIANGELNVVPTEGIGDNIGENDFLKDFQDKIVENWNLQENIRVYSLGYCGFAFKGERINEDDEKLFKEEKARNRKAYINLAYSDSPLSEKEEKEMKRYETLFFQSFETWKNSK